jgi:hypothetical protein
MLLHSASGGDALCLCVCCMCLYTLVYVLVCTASKWDSFVKTRIVSSVMFWSSTETRSNWKRWCAFYHKRKNWYFLDSQDREKLYIWTILYQNRFYKKNFSKKVIINNISCACAIIHIYLCGRKYLDKKK